MGSYGIWQPFLLPGPFPVTDVHGVGLVAACLFRSLDPGINNKTIQFDTMRKMRTAWSHHFQATVSSLGGAVIAKDTRKMHVMSNPTYTLFFERFMEGCHRRMGDKSQADLGLSIEVMMAYQEMLEDE